MALGCEKGIYDAYVNHKITHYPVLSMIDEFVFSKFFAR